MNSLEQYPIVLKQDVIWGDMDAFGHVNNTVYFRYFEDARIEYFNQTGVMQFKEENNIGPILAKTECDFKLPLKYQDSISIAAKSRIVSEKKIEMDYLITSDVFGGVAAQGQGLIIYYDYNLGKSCPIPKKIHEAITNIEL